MTTRYVLRLGKVRGKGEYWKRSVVFKERQSDAYVCHTREVAKTHKKWLRERFYHVRIVKLRAK